MVEHIPFLDNIDEYINIHITETTMPTKLYPSLVKTYGGKLIQDAQGRLVLETKGVLSTIDRIGDPILRIADEHMMKETSNMFHRYRSHPKRLIRRVFPGPLRSRGVPKQIVANAERLGLGNAFGLHPNGIEIKRPEIYQLGVFLYDILRAQEINSPLIKAIDRFDALATASRYIKHIHEEYGAVGEVVGSDIIFQKIEDGRVSDPILDIPDIVFNPKKTLSENSKKATDILDFLIYTGLAELQRSEEWIQVERALEIIVSNYDNPEVIKVIHSFAKRGRLTLVGDEELLHLPKNSITTRIRSVFALHNKVRLGIEDVKKHFGIDDTKAGIYVASLRQQIIDTCEHNLQLDTNFRYGISN